MLDADWAVIVRSRDESPQSGRSPQFCPIPDGLPISSHQRRDSQLEITICDFKLGRSPEGPAAFTELGVAMLSSVLHSERAVQMNIVIMRAFVKLREMIAHHKDIAARMEKLERGHARTASVIEVLVEDIDRLAGEVKQMKAIPAATKRRIGFRLGNHG